MIGIGVGAFMMFGKGSGDAQSAPKGQVETAVVSKSKPAEKAPEKVKPEEKAAAAPAPVAPSMVKIRFASEPAGARVMRGGKEEGKTPLVLDVEKGSEALSFTLKSDGFEDASFDLVPDQDRDATHTLKAVAVAPKPAAKAPAAPKARKKAKKPRPARKKAQEIDGLLD